MCDEIGDTESAALYRAELSTLLEEPATTDEFANAGSRKYVPARPAASPRQVSGLLIPGGDGLVGVPAYNYISEGHALDQRSPTKGRGGTVTATMTTSSNVSLEPPAGFVSTPADNLELELAGTFTVPVGDEHSTAGLVMGVQPLEKGVTVEKLQEVLAERYPEAHVQLMSLPAGRAVAIVRAGEYRLPPEVTGQPETQVIPSIGVQVMLPTPSGKEIVVLDCSTSNEQAWPLVAEKAAAVANSIHYGSES